MKEIQMTKEARKEITHYESAYFDVLYYKEIIEEKGDKKMSVEKCSNQAKKREGQVDQELNNAENAADRLMARVDELETQLHEVLHPSEAAPPTLDKEAQKEAPLVTLANRIRDHYRLLQDLGTRVGEMLERLEIR